MGTIVFQLPKAEERVGEVVGAIDRGGVQMPLVRDHRDKEYPVHPDNVLDVEEARWRAN